MAVAESVLSPLPYSNGDGSVATIESIAELTQFPKQFWIFGVVTRWILIVNFMFFFVCLAAPTVARPLPAPKYFKLRTSVF